MAKAVKNAAVTRTETKTVEVKPEEVVLTLSRQEALALRAVVGGISGQGPIRETTDEIYRALSQAGISFIDASPYINQIKSSLVINTTNTAY